MRTEASLPKPVLIPYALAPEATTRSTTARQAFIRSIAVEASPTSSPRSATAYSCANVRSLPVNETLMRGSGGVRERPRRP